MLNLQCVTVCYSGLLLQYLAPESKSTFFSRDEKDLNWDELCIQQEVAHLLGSIFSDGQCPVARAIISGSGMDRVKIN